MRIAFLAAIAFAPLLAQAAACSARSPVHTTAFVELYTSEGCNSCPPADRWLSSVARSYPRDRVLPLALHVDYWDYIGWKDPFTRREFSQRQRRLSHLQRTALVYTPQVLLQGADFRAWGSRDFDRGVEAINARPAAADLALAIVGGNDLAFRVRVEARADVPEGTSVYVAAYESGSAHAYVVLEWQGPIALGRHELDLPFLPKAKAADSGVAAFVQRRRTGEVLQALALGACAP